MHRLVFGPSNEINDLIIIHTFHHHTIDFDFESFLNQQVDIGHDPFSIIASCDGGVPRFFQRIQTHIHRFHATVFQPFDVLINENPVGGDA